MVMLPGPLILITAIALPPDVAGAQIVSPVLIIRLLTVFPKFMILYQTVELKYINHPYVNNFLTSVIFHTGFIERRFLHTPDFRIV